MPIFHSDSIIKKKLQIVWEAFTYEQSVEVLGYGTPRKDVMLTYNVSINYPGASSGSKIFQEFSCSREESILTKLSPDRFRLFARRTSISSSIRVCLHLNSNNLYPLKEQWLLCIPPAVTVKKLSVLPTQCINVFLMIIKIKQLSFPYTELNGTKIGVFKY
jgi:hypothetical protein